MPKMLKLGLGTALFALAGGFLWLLAHCRHKKISRPFTNMPWCRGQSYVVCLDCGREFDFDWKAMQMGAQRDRTNDKGKNHGL
jgi:hypothetical protein